MARRSGGQTAAPHAAAKPAEQSALTRRRVLEATLAYADEHGLDALTMRKLGTALGVEGTALYNHVQSKDGLLDGLVELLWSEILALSETDDGWQDALRSLAFAVREVTHRHPTAAPLVASRSVMPTEALELFALCLAGMEEASFDRRSAAQALRAVLGYAYGYTVMEVLARGSRADDDAPEPESLRIRRVTQMLPPDVSDDLFEVGLAMCGGDSNALFALGVDLIIAGLKPGNDR